MLSEGAFVSASPSAHAALVECSRRAGSSEAEQSHLSSGARPCPFLGVGTTSTPWHGVVGVWIFLAALLLRA